METGKDTEKGCLILRDEGKKWKIKKSVDKLNHQEQKYLPSNQCWLKKVKTNIKFSILILLLMKRRVEYKKSNLDLLGLDAHETNGTDLLRRQMKLNQIVQI